jgi:16S rRNA processing protein RimM
VPEDSIWFGKTVTVAELRWYNQSPVLFLKDINDRNTAETLIKAILLIDADADALPAEPDAWYDHQLVGLKVLRDSVEVGVGTAVEHFPAQDLLVIKHGEKDVMVPFVKAIVPSVDLKAGTLTVTPPTGLFEEVLPELATPEPATSDEDEAESSESEAVGPGIAAEVAE